MPDRFTVPDLVTENCVECWSVPLRAGESIIGDRVEEATTTLPLPPFSCCNGPIKIVVINITNLVRRHPHTSNICLTDTES